MSHLGYICMRLENLYNVVEREGSLCMCHRRSVIKQNYIHLRVRMAVLNQSPYKKTCAFQLIRVRYSAALIYLVASSSSDSAAPSS